MELKDIIGQQKAIGFLRSLADSDRIPHAQIFLGNEGTGKLAAALAFSQYVLCQHKSDGAACGKCPDCIKASKFIHPDIHFSYPTVGSKAISTNFINEWRTAITENPYLNAAQWLQHIQAENKQGNITKDECLDIVRKLGLKIFEGSHKILILWLPEYLGKEGNRLLKLIEEPPENTLFILVAENAEAILNTILSRCQIVQFKPLEDSDIVNVLESKGTKPEQAANIAHLANGNLNKALNLIVEENRDYALDFLKWMRLCYLAKPKDIIEFSNTFQTLGRENQKRFFDYGLFFLREYMILLMTGNEHLRLGEQEITTAKNLRKVISFDQISPISDLMTDSIFHIQRNANPKILMTDVSIRMNHILRKKTVLV